MKNYWKISINNQDYDVREVSHQGKQYLVVPVVMMIPGVHNGSRGPLLHSEGELSKVPQSWNGIPVTIHHPIKEGTFISANDPQIIEEYKVGVVYNSHYDGGLKAEAWLEIELLKEKSPEVYNAIQKKKIIEVSVGVFSDEMEEIGEFQGELYQRIAMNHRPDHLALLPGGVGACSVVDGCGIRNNSLNNKTGGTVYEEKLKKHVDVLKEHGYIIDAVLNNLSEGFMERLELLHAVVNSMDRADHYYYLQEAYDNYIVYKVRYNDSNTKLYKQNYTMNNSNIELQGNPQEVTRKVEYITASENSSSETDEETEERTITYRRTKFNKNNVDMSKQKCEPCIQKKVEALVANGAYTEEDKDWLSVLEETQLDKMIAASKKEDKKEDQKSQPQTNQTKMEVLSAEEKEALVFGKEQLAKQKQTYIKGIQSNTTEGLWPIDVLNAMDRVGLERLYKSVVKEEEIQSSGQVNYGLHSGNAFVVDSGAKEVQPMAPAGILFEQN